MPALFTLSAAKNGDKVGLILFSDIVDYFSSAKKGTANCMRILRETLLYPHKNTNSNAIVSIGLQPRFDIRKPNVSGLYPNITKQKKNTVQLGFI